MNLRPAALFVTVLLVACEPSKRVDSAPADASPGLPASSVASGPASAASGPDGSTAPAATRKRPRAPRGIEQVAAELHKKCDPAKPADTNYEMKVQAAQTMDCIKRKMIADLDAVLLPLKESDPARFKALMKEQAVFNRYVGESCWLEEERQWVDFEAGDRSDGTARSYAFIGCMQQAMTERTLYARSRAAAAAAPVKKRVLALQSQGESYKATQAEELSKAQAFIAKPPVVREAMMEADWKEFVAKSKAVSSDARELARATCSGWPELEESLGGAAECEKSTELYYLVCGVEPNEEH